MMNSLKALSLILILSMVSFHRMPVSRLKPDASVCLQPESVFTQKEMVPKKTAPKLKKIRKKVLPIHKRELYVDRDILDGWEVLVHVLAKLGKKEISFKDFTHELKEFYETLFLFVSEYFPDNRALNDFIASRSSRNHYELQASTEDKKSLNYILTEQSGDLNFSHFILSLPIHYRIKLFRIMHGYFIDDFLKGLSKKLTPRIYHKVENEPGKIPLEQKKAIAIKLGISFAWLDEESTIRIKPHRKNQRIIYEDNGSKFDNLLNVLSGLDQLTLDKRQLRGRPLYQRFRLLRKNLDWTLVRVSRMAKISTGVISNLEKDPYKRKSQPSKESIRKLKQFYFRLGADESWFTDKAPVVTRRKLNQFLKKQQWSLESLADETGLAINDLEAMYQNGDFSSINQLLVDLFFEYNLQDILYNKELTLNFEEIQGEPLQIVVRKCRLNLGMTEQELADEAIILDRSFKRIEKGQAVNPSTLKKVITVLEKYGLPPNFFYFVSVEEEEVLGLSFREKVKLLLEDVGLSIAYISSRTGIEEKSVRRLFDLDDEYLLLDVTRESVLTLLKEYGVPESWLKDEITLSWEDLKGKTFAEKVELVRINLCWEKQKLAEAVGVHPTYFYHLNEFKPGAVPEETKQKFVDLFVQYGAKEDWFEDHGRFDRILSKAKKGAKQKQGLVLTWDDLIGFSFGEKMVLLRRNFGLTQKDLSSALGLSPKKLSMIERGVNPHLWTKEAVLKLIRYFAGLGVPEEWLIHQLTLTGSPEVTLNKEFLEGRKVAERIKLLRMNLGWSFEDLYQQIESGVHITTLRNIEAGRTQKIHKKKLQAIVTAFAPYGVTEGWFYDSLNLEDIKGKTFKNQIDIFRKKLKMTVRDLAKNAGVGESALRKMSDRTKRSTKEAILCVFLPYGAEIEWFEGFDEKEPLVEQPVDLTLEDVLPLPFHKRIRTIREATGLTRSELAKLAGMTKGQLNSIETRPLKRAMINTYQNLGKLMSVFLLYGVTMDWFSDLEVLKSDDYFEEFVASVVPPHLFETAL